MRVAQAAVEAVRAAWWTAVLAVRFGLGRHDRVRAARLLRAYLLRMGPLYIKAGQVLGTQSGLLPREAVEEFRTFFAELPPMRERALRRMLRNSFGHSVEEVFASFDMRPVAAGSVAQVHRATLAGGETVAVKVVRAGVRGRLEASSTVLGALLSAVHLLPWARGYDLPGHFRELRPLLTGQCDLVGERARQLEVAANFRNHPFVRVPRVHEELSSRDVLVMEFVDGVPGHLHDEVELPPHELAARMQDAFYCMVHFHGVFHVDPHPGNLVFGPGGLLVFLDFGLVGRLSEDDRWNLASFYYACIRREWTTAVRRFTRAFAVRPERLTGSAYEAELGRILRRHFEEEASRWSTLAFLDDAIRLLGRHGSRITTAFSVLALSLLTGEGYISKVDPDIDLWATTRRFTDRFAPYLNDDLRDRFQHRMVETAPRSMALRERAARRLVAPTHFDRFVMPSAFPLVVDRAYGSRLRDVDGNEYIDLGGGFGPHILGYAHPAVVAAIQDAAARGAVNAVGHPGEVRLAELIAEAFGPDHRVLLANSGTEAVQIALRIARAYTGRQRVAKFEGHYHGFSDQGLVSSWFRYRGDARAPEPVGNSAGMQDSVVAETLVLQYGDRGSLDRIAAHADELACVIVEPMPSALADYDAEFLRALSDVCGKAGVLVVYDEVVTGFRVAYGGVQHIVGTVPDLTCLGKIIGGGLPAGAVTGRADVVETARTSGDPFHDVDGRAFAGGTMSGNSVTCAAGTAVLEQLRAWPRLYPRLRERTSWLVADLAARAADCGVPCQVRGRDSIFSITFDHAAPSLVRDRMAGLDVTATLALAYHLRGHGVFLPELHTLLLSAAHSDTDLEQVSEAFGKSVREMASAGFFSISRESLTGERK